MNVGRLSKFGLVIGALSASFYLGNASARGFRADPGSAEEMESALRAAFELSDPEIRASEMRRLIGEIDEVTLPGAHAVFRDQSATSEALGVSEFFARWSQIDLEGMVDELRSWPDDGAAAQGMGWATYRLALRGGTRAAVGYFDSLPERFRLFTGYRLVEGALNGGDEEEFVRWLAELDDDAERSRLIQSAVFKLLRERGTDGTLEFFDGVPDDAPRHFKRQIHLVLLERLARVDSSRAIALLTAHADEPWAEGGRRTLALAWTDVDPRSALSWVESWPPDAERERSIEAVVDRWAMRDEPSAIAWSEERSESPLLDRLRSQFSGSTIIRAPDQSIHLAARIADPGIRGAALRKFARYWFQRRPDDTSAWLTQAGLSESEAEELIAALALDRERRLGRGRAGRG